MCWYFSCWQCFLSGVFSVGGDFGIHLVYLFVLGFLSCFLMVSRVWLLAFGMPRLCLSDGVVCLCLLFLGRFFSFSSSYFQYCFFVSHLYFWLSFAFFLLLCYSCSFYFILFYAHLFFLLSPLFFAYLWLCFCCWLSLGFSSRFGCLRVWEHGFVN